MRAGLNDAELLYVDDLFVGVNLGWDHCAEHEWGIKEIRRDFGIPEGPTRKVYGFNARKITKVPENLKGFTVKGAEYLVYSPYGYSDSKEPHIPHGLSEQSYREKTFRGAWGSSDFGACLKTIPGKTSELKELFQAFQEKNVVFFFGASGPFSNSGMKVCIADRIPEESQKEAEAADLDSLDLKDAVAATGILGKLKDAQQASSPDRNYNRKCGYYACSPKWWSDAFKPQGRDIKSAHNVVFFLNPQDQENNKSGWFTVEDLEQWIEGKGPIPGKRTY